MEIAREAEAEWAGEAESVTCTVNLYWPTVVGVPLIVPSEARVRPRGNAPELTIQLYEGVPPEAPNIFEYELPATPGGRDVVVTDNVDVAAVIEIDNDPDAD
jgi:hypothetical protein